MNRYTVTGLNTFVKQLLEEEIPPLFVEGEIDNFKRHSSGHWYFSLKDADSTINCTFFSFFNKYTDFVPKSGEKVLAYGQPSIYAPRGTYQLNLKKLIKLGKGDLHKEFELLKSELEELGYFDNSRKKRLPQFPRTIGVVTSPTSAAVRDIINVLERRYPLCSVLLYPCQVQGPDAEFEIADGIKFFNEEKADVIIAGRGGGSMEDLWAFNSRIVADAIYNSIIPVVSAVGHEIDFTIADFTSDLRAPTPSAAAELVCPDLAALSEGLAMTGETLQDNMLLRLNQLSDKLDGYRLDYRLNSVFHTIDMYKQKLDNIEQSYENRIQNYLEKNKNYLEKLQSRLQNLEPESVLKRGYAIVEKDKKVVTDSSTLDSRDRVLINFHQGSAEAEIINTSGD